MRSNIGTIARRYYVVAAVIGLAVNAFGQTLVSYARGGGLDTNAPMIHADIFYDYTNNQMQVRLDHTRGIPKLTPLPPGYAFPASSNYAVLSGKAYNLQYAWNPGGIFTNPPGAALWIECIGASAGLECYDGPGNKMVNPPRTFAPIFGTAGSSSRWKWYGSMAHNSYAILNPTTNMVTADYRVYFGDAQTGDPGPFSNYGTATVTLTWQVAEILVEPSMGGGQVYADMVHINVYYDAEANQLHALLDDGTPMLRPLEPGFAFAPDQPYSVLTGKAYNAQYGWNVGGFFGLPSGAKIWIELIASSPGLEMYEEYSYAPIFGTAGSSRLWQWEGRMVHNTYALRPPPVGRAFAEYRVFFGEANTGVRDGFRQYDDTTVRLEWLVTPDENPARWLFGAEEQTNEAPLMFINSGQFTTQSGTVINLVQTNSGPCASEYAAPFSIMAVPATSGNGGPFTNAAAPGARLEILPLGVTGPPGASLSFWEPGSSQPWIKLSVNGGIETNRLSISQNEGRPGDDPYGCVAGRYLSADKAGLYCLTFQVIDSSTNGPAHGPLHAPSPIYRVYLQAGITIEAVARHGASVTARYGGMLGRMFYLESSVALGTNATWTNVAGPLKGTNCLQSLVHSNASPAAYFRLRVE